MTFQERINQEVNRVATRYPMVSLVTPSEVEGGLYRVLASTSDQRLHITHQENDPFWLSYDVLGNIQNIAPSLDQSVQDFILTLSVGVPTSGMWLYLRNREFIYSCRLCGTAVLDLIGRPDNDAPQSLQHQRLCEPCKLFIRQRRGKRV